MHGLILGLLLLWHSNYFVPLAVATLLGMAVDRFRRRPAPLSVGRAVGVALVGLLGLLGVVWIVWRFRVDRLTEGIGVGRTGSTGEGNGSSGTASRCSLRRRTT